MIFNSVTFLLFLFFVVLLFWSLNNKIRVYFLLISSCLFYGFWRWEFLIVLFISALVDYFVSIKIYNTPKEFKKKDIYFCLLLLF